MSLIQFLSVTRTFGAVRDAPSRFKMTQENLLPKFGPKAGASEPVLHAEEPAVDRETSAVKVEEKIRAPVGKTGARHRNEPLGKRTQMSEGPAKMKTEILEQSRIPGEPASGSSPRKGWTLLTGVLLWPVKGLGKLFGFSSPLQSKASRPARKRGPVQGELGLDMVRPVRNDLNDSDLELIPAPKPLAESECSLKLVKPERAVRGMPKSRAIRPSAQGNVFSPRQESEAGPTAPPELAYAGKTDLVGAWWGRLRTGLSRIRSRET
jgi:hypothetical protein